MQGSRTRRRRSSDDGCPAERGVSAGDRRDPSRCVAPGRRARARRPPGRRASPAGRAPRRSCRSSRRGHVRGAPATLPRAPGASSRRTPAGDDRCDARSARSHGTRTPPASGQASQRGVGRHTSRPRFMTAWFQSPGASRASHRDAASATSASATSSGSAAELEPGHHLADVRVDRGDGRAERDRRHRGRRVRTDAGEREQRGEVGRHGAVVIANDATSGLVQRRGAPRVPQSAPRTQDVSPRRLGERAHVGEPVHEHRERLDHARRLRLLEHHLGDEHRVRIPLALTPRIDGAVRPEPREQQTLRRRAFAADRGDASRGGHRDA